MLILENAEAAELRDLNGVARERVLESWIELSRDLLDEIGREPWLSGYEDRDSRPFERRTGPGHRVGGVVVAAIEGLRVVRFATDRVPNPDPAGDIPWQRYHGVRNAIVRACRRHGPTGPMGEVQLIEGVEDVYKQALRQPGFWPRGDDQPSYYIVPDQYNHERYVYAELYGDDPFTPAWVADVIDVLGTYPGWGLGINNLPGTYVLLFGDRLMVKGRAFGWWPKSANQVVEIVRRLLRGAAG